jgi:hypothetical protein
MIKELIFHSTPLIKYANESLLSVKYHDICELLSDVS